MTQRHRSFYRLRLHGKGKAAPTAAQLVRAWLLQNRIAGAEPFFFFSIVQAREKPFVSSQQQQTGWY